MFMAKLSIILVRAKRADSLKMVKNWNKYPINRDLQSEYAVVILHRNL